MPVKFIVVILDDNKLANHLDHISRDIEREHFKIRYFSVGQAMVGLQFKGNRPTEVIDLTTVRDDDYDKKWRTHCVKPMIDHIERRRRRLYE
ncbi:hypothetical protein FZC76_21700 [Sutcliffiella horikoshii]|uniref:Uncharacterized protein n=1 Tax=Sutcliffiella horikoshii TaxID=79883 RepID=A0A5D4SDU7_9BACI|nr:hypothetical protein [Sutcliffiella horikoshii]TYS60488.1 hypothetical protein FZC76_21700 [Sutcliffiella horikoshii]